MQKQEVLPGSPVTRNESPSGNRSYCYARWFERLLAELGFELWIGGHHVGANLHGPVSLFPLCKPAPFLDPALTPRIHLIVQIQPPPRSVVRYPPAHFYQRVCERIKQSWLPSGLALQGELFCLSA